MRSDLRTTYLGVNFRNPFILASAPPTATGDMVRQAFEAGWGGAVIKTLTYDAVHNLANRFATIRNGNRITGFENLELLSEQTPDEWYQAIAVIKADFPHCPIIGSIMGTANSPDEWLSLARGCQDAGADLLELNFSCPHGYPERGRGAAIGQNADYASRITGWLTGCKDISIPIIPKLTAAVADIRHIAEELAQAGAHGFCAINTIPSFFGFDLHTLRPRPDIDGLTSYGGYSGPGIKPIALRAVSELCQSPGLPVMASGGIASGFDAAEFMLLGAPVVQVGTEVMLRGFGVVDNMQRDMREFMEWHDFTSPADFTGCCLNRVTGFGKLSGAVACRPHLSEDRCTHCGACVIACRDGGYQAIALNHGLPVFQKASCAGCSLCSHVCPGGAIRMKQEPPMAAPY
jgi:dihydropyrimidine dehydrogenase (NAD+) subunit PreA